MATTPKTELRPIFYKDKTHRPALTNEVVDTDMIPVSATAGNILQVKDDGLYVGGSTSPGGGSTGGGGGGSGGTGSTPVGSGSHIFAYVSSSGADLAANGAKTQPYKTLTYAMAQILAKDATTDINQISSYVTVALKAGETFDLSDTFVVSGYVIFTFYGDANYGDFDSPRVAGICDASLMADLNRPIIQATPITSLLGSIMNGLRLVVNGRIMLSGVRVDLPATGGDSNPANFPTAYGDYADFVTATSNSLGQLDLYGAVVNMVALTNPYGIFGVHGRCSGAKLTQFASQFWYQGAIFPTSGATITAARKYFIKMYKDYPGNRQSNSFLDVGSAGSGILMLNWSETQSMAVSAGKTNLGTYPIVQDLGQGLGNYIMNIARDQQSRALNVVCGLRI